MEPNQGRVRNSLDVFRPQAWMKNSAKAVSSGGISQSFCRQDRKKVSEWCGLLHIESPALGGRYRFGLDTRRFCHRDLMEQWGSDPAHVFMASHFNDFRRGFAFHSLQQESCKAIRFREMFRRMLIFQYSHFEFVYRRFLLS